MIEHYAYWALILAAVVAIIVVSIHAMGLNIPDWVVRIFWIIVIFCVAALALKVVFSVV